MKESEKTNMQLKQSLIRLILLAAGVIMVLFGVLRGEAGIVLAKAIRLCLECVGIGQVRKNRKFRKEGNLVSSRPLSLRHPVSGYAADQHSPAQLFQRQNLSGKRQDRLCTRSELLFLPRRCRLLPHRCTAGSHRLFKVPIFLLYYRISDSAGSPAGKIYLRLSLSVRLVSRSAA